MTNPYSQPAAQYAPPPYNPAGRTNVLAIVALIASVLGFSIVGVVLGHIAVSQIKRSNEGGSALAVIGVVLGYLGCLAWIVFWGVLLLGFVWAGAYTGSYPSY